VSTVTASPTEIALAGAVAVVLLGFVVAITVAAAAGFIRETRGAYAADGGEER
jgi:hypothetical protein